MHTNSIENLWKLIKDGIRRKGIKTKYIEAVCRYYFFKSLDKEQQTKIITTTTLVLDT